MKHEGTVFVDECLKPIEAFRIGHAGTIGCCHGLDLHTFPQLAQVQVSRAVCATRAEPHRGQRFAAVASQWALVTACPPIHPL